MVEIKRVLVLPDVHLTETVPRVYNIIKKILKDPDYKYPDEIILLGDFMDVESLSAWDMDRRRVMEHRRFKKEIDCANKELDFLQSHTYKITYIEGNHENRVERYLDKHPEMEGLLEIKDKLRLDDREIQFVRMNDLYKIGKLYFTHGMYTNMYHAKNHIQRLGCNIMYGHTHQTQTHLMNMKMQEPIMGWGLGCLCDKSPAYMKNRPSNWINQFSEVEFDEKGNFNVIQYNIIKNKCIYKGKIFK